MYDNAKNICWAMNMLICEIMIKNVIMLVYDFVLYVLHKIIYYMFI